MVPMQWLASKYSGMGFKPVEVRRHGACLFTAAVERYGKLPSNPASYNVPGTFLDVPASTSLRALTHACIMNRYLKCALPVPVPFPCFFVLQRERLQHLLILVRSGGFYLLGL